MDCKPLKELVVFNDAKAQADKELDNSFNVL
jgi:hypothetical protein